MRTTPALVSMWTATCILMATATLLQQTAPRTTSTVNAIQTSPPRTPKLPASTLEAHISTTVAITTPDHPVRTGTGPVASVITEGGISAGGGAETGTGCIPTRTAFTTASNTRNFICPEMATESKNNIYKENY